MEKTVRLSRKTILYILITAGLLIFFASVEAILKAKDTELFLLLQKAMADKGKTLLYPEYVTVTLMSYFMKILTPMGYAITAYLAFKTFRYGNSFMAVWGIVLLGSLVLHLLTLELNNIFFYITGLFYLMLLASLIMLKSEYDREINNR